MDRLLEHRARLAICLLLSRNDAMRFSRLKELLEETDGSLGAHLLKLEKEDPFKAQLVNLRYFSGMSMEEAAQVLGVSERTLHRHWQFIKAWLKSRLE